MQSSPPAFAHTRTRRVSSPGTSEYSLDLAALDPDSSSSTPIPKQNISKLLSDDINGPSDFTMNMNSWINGERAIQDGIDGPSDFTLNMGQWLDSARAVQRNQDLAHDTKLSEPSSPTSSRNTTVAQTERDAKSVALQPTVEDYQSEFIPEPSKSVNVSRSSSTVMERATYTEAQDGQLSEHIEILKTRCEELQRMNQELQASIHEMMAESRRGTSQLQTQNKSLEEALLAERATRAKEEIAANARESKLKDDLTHVGQELVAGREETDRLREEAKGLRQHVAMLESTTSDQEKTQAMVSGQVEKRVAELIQKHAIEVRGFEERLEKEEIAHQEERQRIVKENDELNAAMDSRISAAVKKRGQLHKGAIESKDEQIAAKDVQIAELEKDRKIMSRELLRAWGREEFGATVGKQKYRYQHT